MYMYVYVYMCVPLYIHICACMCVPMQRVHMTRSEWRNQYDCIHHSMHHPLLGRFAFNLPNEIACPYTLTNTSVLIAPCHHIHTIICPYI